MSDSLTSKLGSFLKDNPLFTIGAVNPSPEELAEFKALKESKAEDRAAGQELARISDLLRNQRDPSKSDLLNVRKALQGTPPLPAIDPIGTLINRALGIQPGRTVRGPAASQYEALDRQSGNAAPQRAMPEELRAPTILEGRRAPTTLETQGAPAEKALRRIAAKHTTPPVPEPKPVMRVPQSSAAGQAAPAQNRASDIETLLNNVINDPLVNFGSRLLSNSTGKSFGRALGDSIQETRQAQAAAAQNARENALADRKATAYEQQLEQTDPMYRWNQARALMESQKPADRELGKLIMQTLTADVMNARARLMSAQSSGAGKTNANKLFYSMGEGLLNPEVETTITPETLDMLSATAPTSEAQSRIEKVKASLEANPDMDQAQLRAGLSLIVGSAPK